MKPRLWLPAALLAALLLGGCPSPPIQDPPPRPESPASDARPPVEPPKPGLPPEFQDPSNPLFQRVVYFDYDSSDLLPQFIEVLRAHALYLATHPRVRLRLEGHADERGTREYNLALAEQRAHSVRRFLLAEGVSGKQLTTLSYGEELPAQPGHDEAAWALNRRVELLYGDSS